MRTLSRKTVPSVSNLNESADDFSFSAVNTNLKFFSAEESEASKVFPEISAFIFPEEADDASKLRRYSVPGTSGIPSWTSRIFASLGFSARNLRMLSVFVTWNSAPFLPETFHSARRFSPSWNSPLCTRFPSGRTDFFSAEFFGALTISSRTPEILTAAVEFWFPRLNSSRPAGSSASFILNVNSKCFFCGPRFIFVSLR